MTNVELRRADNREFGVITELWLQTRKASVPAIPPPARTDEEVRATFADGVLRDRDVWVAVNDGAIVAMMVLHDEWLDQLYVAPDWSGKGIGSRLLELAKTLRPTGLRLWTFQANSAARRFYERHGFAAVAMTDGDNEEHAPDVRYEWSSRTLDTAR